MDHCPPRSARPYLDPRRFEFVEVRCCGECNSLLGARCLFTLRERRRFIRLALRLRYRAALRPTRWRPHELEELGPGLRSTIERRLVEHDIAKARIDWAQRSR